ncbi:MAG: MSHA biogenesis protein MshO [Candidatus Endobugula sp.]|jgi:MSHA biogenesis protein MshO
MKSLKNNVGFTLVEIILVMVILGIIASFTTAFVISTMRSFVSVNSKNSLLAESILSTEYMVRRLRNALPYSTRLSNDGSCLQFMPIVSSGLYLDILPSVINGAFSSGSITPIQVSPFIVSGGDSDYLAIAANSSDELFGFSPGSIAAISSTTTNSITLLSDKQWLRNSITQRFYIVEAPSAFCLVNNELRLYRKFSIENSIVNVAGAYDLLSKSASALGQVFSISSAVEDRNIRVTLSLLFSQDDNRLESIKQVVVRNVP